MKGDICKIDGCFNRMTYDSGKVCNTCRYLRSGIDFGAYKKLVPATYYVYNIPKFDKYKDQRIEEQLWSHQNDWDGFGTYKTVDEPQTVGESYFHKIAKAN